MQPNSKNDAAKEETLSINFSALKEALQTVVDQGCAALMQLSKQPAADVGKEFIQKAKKGSKKAVENCMVSAKEHPIEALLIAFGLGFLVVKFLKRK